MGIEEFLVMFKQIYIVPKNYHHNEYFKFAESYHEISDRFNISYKIQLYMIVKAYITYKFHKVLK